MLNYDQRIRLLELATETCDSACEDFVTHARRLENFVLNLPEETAKPEDVMPKRQVQIN